jgi:hypothetical protein
VPSQKIFWNIVRKKTPPIKTPFWGADLFNGGVFLCYWDGKATCDDGSPCCWKMDNEHDDDLYIFVWAEAFIPGYPSKMAKTYGTDYRGPNETDE